MAKRGSWTQSEGVRFNVLGWNYLMPQTLSSCAVTIDGEGNVSLLCGDDLADYVIACARLDDGEPTFSLDEVEQELGLVN